MKRNYSASACPACGLFIANRKELPFSTKRSWRIKVAEKLGYNCEFILSLGEKTRIHRYHFEESDVRNGKPIGLPKNGIVLIENWPRTKNLKNDESYNQEEFFKVDVETADAENEPILEQVNDNNCVLVEISQLKLLLRQCFYCGKSINESSLKLKTKGGVLFTTHFCSNCNKRRFWRSFKSPFIQLVSSASMLAGINFAKIIQLFIFLRCLFPSKSPLYMASQVIRPIIQNYYEFKNTKLLNYLRGLGSVHLAIDSQYDSPGFCAYYCTVSALESTTKKIVGFVTVKRSEANNKSSNAEPIGTRQLVSKFLADDLPITSITTDGSKTLERLFATEFPNIAHYLDLWHILKNLYRKFHSKFNIKLYGNLKQLFTRLTKHIWKCGEEKIHEANHGNIMIQKCLSGFFHMAGVHSWREGKFVEIYSELIGAHDFQPGLIHDIWMHDCLRCNHDAIVTEDLANPESIQFKLLLDELCSDLRIQQLVKSARFTSTSLLELHHSVLLNYRPKRYHFWYIDVRTMLGVIHHNANIDAELSGERVVEYVSKRIGRNSGLPTERLHKTVLTSWQLELMDYILSNAKEQHLVIEESLADQSQETISFDDNDEPDGEAYLDQYWLNYFDNVVNI